MLLSALFQKLQPSSQDSEWSRYCSCFNNLVNRFMMHIFVQIANESLTTLKLINFSLLNCQWNFLVFLFDYNIQFEIEQVFQVLFFFRASSLKKPSNCGFFYSIFSKIAVFIRADGPILFKIFRLNQLSYFRHFFRELALINDCLDFLAWSISLKTRESYSLFIAFKRLCYSKLFIFFYTYLSLYILLLSFVSILIVRSLYKGLFQLAYYLIIWDISFMVLEKLDYVLQGVPIVD